MSKNRISALLLAFVMLLGFSAAAEQKTQSLEVSLVWVNIPDQLTQDLAYSYEFVNQQTGEVFPVLVDKNEAPQGETGMRIVHAQATALLPAQNSDGTPAIYLLDQKGLGYVDVNGVSYAVSTSESQDPKDGEWYTNRLRVLTRQINPLAQVTFEGVKPQPITLTLQMNSWSLVPGGNGRRASHAASVTVSDFPEQGINLLEVFRANPDDAALFRHFTLAELSYNGKEIAGENVFTLKAEEIAGLSVEVTGNSEDGFHVVVKAAQ